MIIYYRFAGLVASVALGVNLILTVGFMVVVNATFTLPGLAGLVLMLGMAVDANILIYERLREERDRGATILQALRNGYDRALPTIIDTHLSSIFTAIVLYIVGNDQLKGFGVSMTVGLLISLYTSLFLTRVIFDLWAAMGWLRKLSMFRLFSRPDIDFMSIRYYLFAATGILTVLGGALFIGRLPDDLSIDFVGGTAYSGQLVETKTIEELRDLVGDKNQKARLTAKAKEIDLGNLTYALWYGSGDANDKSLRTVLLANKPEGETPEERAEDVAVRRPGPGGAGLKKLPDWAVEQIFIGTEDDGSGRSSYFTVRTTEKEADSGASHAGSPAPEGRQGRVEAVAQKSPHDIRRSQAARKGAGDTHQILRVDGRRRHRRQEPHGRLAKLHHHSADAPAADGLRHRRP